MSLELNEVMKWDRTDRRHITSLISPAIKEQRIDVANALEDARAAYVVGSGLDFTEYGSEFAKSLAAKLSGVACIWQRPSPVLFPLRRDNDQQTDQTPQFRSFNIQQEYIEPADRRCSVIVYCQSIVADEMDALTLILRVRQEIKAKRVLVASVIMSSSVVEFLDRTLPTYGLSPHFVVRNIVDADLRHVRDNALEALDDRELKIVPLMSEWLMERMFGPRPEPRENAKFGMG